MSNSIQKNTALIFGATGLVGNELTHLLLSNEHYDVVKIFVRNKTGLQHPKLIEVVNSLENLEEISAMTVGNHLFCCLGTTIKKAGSQEAFERVDLHLPINIAEIAFRNGIRKLMVVSSIGAKHDSGNFYLRTKGKMEQGIQAISFESICIVRPSILLGKRKENRPAEAFGKAFINLFSVLLSGPLRKYRGIQAITVARAMIRLALSDEKRIILESDKVEDWGK